MGLVPLVRRGRGRGPGVANPAPAPGPVYVDYEESDEDFRDFIAELFITNSISGRVTQKIYHKAAKATAEGVSDLARVGNSGRAWKNNADF